MDDPEDHRVRPRHAAASAPKPPPGPGSSAACKRDERGRRRVGQPAPLDGAFDTASLLAAAVCVVTGAISLLFLRAGTTVEAHPEAGGAAARTHVAEVIPTARR